MYRILIVDDESHVTEAMSLLLQEQTDMDTEIFTANSAAQALEIMEGQRIDLLLTDISMPDMSGLSLLEATRKRWPLCQVVMLTGYTDFDYAYKAFNLKASGFLLKTEPEEVVVRTLKTLLEQSEQQLKDEIKSPDVPTASARADARLLRLLESDPARRRHLLEELGFSTDGEELVLCLCAAPADQPVHQLDALIRRHLGERVSRMAYAVPEDGRPLWLIQMTDACSLSLMCSILETVQDICRSAHGSEPSFALIPAAADDLPKALAKLSALLEPADQGPGSIVTLSSAVPTSFSTESVVRFVKEYIKEHMDDGLTISTLSQVSGYNADYLTRIFRNATGETISQYLTGYRMDMIRTLLRDPQLSVDDIAKQTGFSSRSYFNRFVRRATGMSPKALRMSLLMSES